MGFGDFIRNQFIDVIEYVDNNEEKTLVHKFTRDDDEIKQGAQLIVRNGQVAVFVHRGQIADVFEPGNYKLDTGNLPILSELAAIPYALNSPIKSDLYFVNTTQNINNKWSTPNPIIKRDLEMGVVRITSNGTFSFKIKDATVFMTEMFGARNLNMTNEIVEYLTSFVSESIAQCIGESEQSVIDLAMYYRDFSSIITPYINQKANQLGIEVTTATIEHIGLPATVEKLIDEQSGIGLAARDMDTFVQYQTARAIRDVAKQPGGLAGIGAGMSVGTTIAQSMTKGFEKTSPSQKQPAKQSPSNRETANQSESIADKLVRYKELLDRGILTEDEYNEVKVMLLKEI